MSSRLFGFTRVNTGKGELVFSLIDDVDGFGFSKGTVFTVVDDVDRFNLGPWGRDVES